MYSNFPIMLYIPQPGSVAVHQNMHSREKVFSCDTCARQFHSAVGLKRHLVVSIASYEWKHFILKTPTSIWCSMYRSDFKLTQSSVLNPESPIRLSKHRVIITLIVLSLSHNLIALYVRPRRSENRWRYLTMPEVFVVNPSVTSFVKLTKLVRILLKKNYIASFRLLSSSSFCLIFCVVIN